MIGAERPKLRGTSSMSYADDGLFRLVTPRPANWESRACEHEHAGRTACRKPGKPRHG